jgi:hypothetical protein
MRKLQTQGVHHVAFSRSNAVFRQTLERLDAH